MKTNIMLAAGHAYNASARFLVLRKLLALFKKIALFRRKYIPKTIEQIAPVAHTLFGKINGQQVISELHSNAIFTGLQLPENNVDEIVNFAKTSACERWLESINEPKFTYNNIQQGLLADGRQAVIVDVQCPEKCGAVQQLIDDPVLRDIMEGYLNFSPSCIEARLFWNIKASDDGNSLNKTEQAYKKADLFHYDLGYQNCYVYFYLTSVTDSSGAHVMIEGTHRQKSVRHLLSSRYLDDAQARKYYPNQKCRVITGNAGSGFIEDPNCLHKVMIPRSHDRLVLQLRYY